MSKEVKENLLLSRASYFSRTLGINDKSNAEEVIEKYWFIAPLKKIDIAAKIISLELEKELKPVGSLNTTTFLDNFNDEELKAKFREKATLDEFIYNLCVSRFESISEDLLKCLKCRDN